MFINGAGKGERLDKILVSLGVGSRSEVQKLVKRGQVLLNGNLMKDPSVHIQAQGAVFSIQGEELVYTEFAYYMLNKPQGVLSATRSPVGEQTVMDLLSPKDSRPGIFPVGRLDKDSEGLLLLSNDGKLAHRLLSPKRHVPKRYLVSYEGIPEEGAAEAFKNGIILDDGELCLPASLILQPSEESMAYRQLDSAGLTWAEVIITEGKFHQVKRMMQVVGCNVTWLKRISFGSLLLDKSLAPGEYRPLTGDEVAALSTTTKEDSALVT